MPRAPITRRAFVARALALLAATSVARRAAGVVAAGRGRHRAPGHPTPRPGVTAARVVPATQLADEEPAVRAAFDEVRRIPAVADGVRCHCGCADEPGHYSLLSCYEGDGMARHCVVCQGQGRMAYRLHRAGKSLAEIRAAVDERYG